MTKKIYAIMVKKMVKVKKPAGFLKNCVGFFQPRAGFLKNPVGFFQPRAGFFPHIFKWEKKPAGFFQKNKY